MDFEEKGDRNICGGSDCFVIDVGRFSHLAHTTKDTNLNPTITRNVSRKGQKNINPATPSRSNDNTIPSAAMHGGSTPEKPVVHHHHHHQIVVKNGALSTPASENKQFGPRQSPSTWSIDPRRILIFFATLSSVGTILLIYLTLSMRMLNKDNNDDLN